jgi:hypothetical protein
MKDNEELFMLLRKKIYDWLEPATASTILATRFRWIPVIFFMNNCARVSNASGWIKIYW